MSEENVEIVRRIYEAAARRDAETAFELYAPDIVWDLSQAGTAHLLTHRVSHGRKGVRQAWREGLDAFGEIDLTLDELTDAGDRVLAAVREEEVGRTSGVPVSAYHFAVWTLVDGKVTRMQVFGDRREALEAAGLPQ
jgi:ketosteroid isomerase-like protein